MLVLIGRGGETGSLINFLGFVVFCCVVNGWGMGNRFCLNFLREFGVC